MTASVKAQVRAHGTTGADLVGGGLLVAGATAIYQPLGYLVAGGLILFGSWVAAGRKGET